MGFQGKEHMRTKFVMNGKIIEQVRDFNYLGCNMMECNAVYQLAALVSVPLLTVLCKIAETDLLFQHNVYVSNIFLN